MVSIKRTLVGLFRTSNVFTLLKVYKSAMGNKGEVTALQDFSSSFKKIKTSIWAASRTFGGSWEKWKLRIYTDDKVQYRDLWDKTSIRRVVFNVSISTYR